MKNGPIDFQPREPFHPLFGAMPRTPLMMELQITKEYLGFATHLVYLAPLFEEVLRADTYARGEGSTVAKVVDGIARRPRAHRHRRRRQHRHRPQLVRLASSPGELVRVRPPGLGSDARLGGDRRRVDAHDVQRTTRRASSRSTTMMLASREAVVDYMTPLGLHHLMAEGHHYGPGPWVDAACARRLDLGLLPPRRRAAASASIAPRAAATPSAQYSRAVAERLRRRRDRCPSELLLWFHHVPWDHRMASGRTLWDELALALPGGVDAVRRDAGRLGLRSTAASTPSATTRCARSSRSRSREARWWRDACLLYFQTFSKLPAAAGRRAAPSTTSRTTAPIQKRYVPGI